MGQPDAGRTLTVRTGVVDTGSAGDNVKLDCIDSAAARRASSGVVRSTLLVVLLLSRLRFNLLSLDVVDECNVDDAVVVIVVVDDELLLCDNIVVVRVVLRLGVMNCSAVVSEDEELVVLMCVDASCLAECTDDNVGCGVAANLDRKLTENGSNETLEATLSTRRYSINIIDPRKKKIAANNNTGDMRTIDCHESENTSTTQLFDTFFL